MEQIKIYAIVEREQQCDGDGWEFWINDNMIKFFQKSEDAQTHLDSIQTQESYNDWNESNNGEKVLDKYFIKELTVD